MNIIDIIVKKKNKKVLTYEEIKFAVDNYVNGNIKDYQMSSLLMAIVLNGMTEQETIDLTKVMIDSGDKIDLSKINGTIVDKHSTGGVGDKTTLVLAPLVSSVGVKVAKMSGRGLGHTGGTIDKLESIEGFKVTLTNEEFINQVNDIGCAVISQTANIVPADKKLYALRDVTGTTESIPLIASSIMSKKIASGADAIVLDVKVGNGALMKDIDSATKLANLMIKIGKSYNKKTICVLSNMEEPLGKSIGNSLEVLESIETLKGKGPSDLHKLVLTLGSIMTSIALNITEEEAKLKLLESIKTGKALEKFNEFVRMQNGNVNNIQVEENYVSIKSSKDGFIKSIDAYKLGEIARKIGAGRLNKEDEINYGVGIVLNKKVGDYLFENEELLKIYSKHADVNIKEISECFEIVEEKIDKPNLIIDIIE
ncbi:MAG: thymidine phosphorylase [Lactobacillales bacterium]|nr:thymidine phosphorylase [Lactobacillales bacterium]